ncbi:MAG: S8 family serine peptidase [Rubrivivax sp.]|jgi:subtilisin family serine protease
MMTVRKMSTLAAAAAVACSLLAGTAVQAAPAKDQVRLIVAYKLDGAPVLRALVAKLGGTVVRDLEDVDALAISLPRAALANLRAAKAVDYVEEDAVRTIQGARSAAKASAAAVAATSQTVPYGITLTQADQITGTPAWKPKVCIVDSGIDGGHEDLVGNTMAGKNLTTSGTWNSDESAHGTHVAGTIAALNNSLGVVGVNGNKQVSLYIAKVFDASDSASTSTIVAGINACARARANVVSMSLGGSSASQTEKRALDKLYNRGALLIAASGNAGTTAVSYPAGFPNVMSVAAVDSSMAWASFSQYNPEVEIAAPGVAVQSTVPPNLQSMAVTSVGGTSYPTLAMDGAPALSATGPLADFGLGEAAVAGSMTGKVCLISRGNISFADKVVNCTASGGIGAIIYNNTAGELAGTMGTVVTTIPSVGATQADGATMLTQLGQSASVGIVPDPSKYAAFNGTSMATPHVSAIAALVWSYYPQCTGEQIRSTLKKSALDIDAPGVDNKTGAGLVQARAAFDRIATLGCGN